MFKTPLYGESIFDECGNHKTLEMSIRYILDSKRLSRNLL